MRKEKAIQEMISMREAFVRSSGNLQNWEARSKRSLLRIFPTTGEFKVKELSRLMCLPEFCQGLTPSEQQQLQKERVLFFIQNQIEEIQVFGTEHPFFLRILSRN